MEVRRKARRGDRRARKAPVEVQALEARQLLANWTALGYSLPDLSVTGFAAPVAAYGQPIAVTARVQNLGAASIYEPLALEPGAPSAADAPPTNVGVYISRLPFFTRGAVRIGEVPVPYLRQNSTVEVTGLVAMPPEGVIRGLPREGGTVYLFFRADDTGQIQERDRTNNLNRHGVPVQTAPPLPDVYSLALDVPPVMQPGDAIAPAIKIVNYGTVNTNLQRPFTVALVASTDENFGPGDLVLQSYTIESLPPLAMVPMQETVLGDVFVQDPINILTLRSQEPVILPPGPEIYYIGVAVDPENAILEINELGGGPIDPILGQIRQVGPPFPNFAPAGVIAPTPDPNFVFPIPPFGPFPTIYGTIVEEPPIIIVEDPVVIVDTASGSVMASSSAVAVPSANTSPAPGGRALRPAQRVTIPFPYSTAVTNHESRWTMPSGPRRAVPSPADLADLFSSRRESRTPRVR